jgi:hypothetical protein
VIGRINWLSKEWAVQTIRILKKDAKGYGIRPYWCHWGDPAPKQYSRGYVKIWRMVNGERVVVDRALTQTAARRRIKFMKANKL